MSNPNININVGGPQKASSTYETVILKGNKSFASQVTKPNMKYVIKYDFDLSSGGVVYDGWDIEGMGGNPSIIDGEEYWLTDYESGIAEPTTYTLVDDECFFVIDGHISDIKEVTLQYEENTWIATKRKGYHARILSHYDSNAAITIPENCVLEFDGGNLSDGKLIGNNTIISADLVKIFDTDIQFDGTFLNKTLYVEWFGAVPDDDSKAVQNVSAINAACVAAVSHSGDNVDDALKAINSVTLQPKSYYVDGTLRVPSAYFHFGAEEEKPIGYVNHRMATIQQVSDGNIPVITLINREITATHYKEGVDHLIIENLEVVGNGKTTTSYGIGKEVSDETYDADYLMWVSDTKFNNVFVSDCRFGIYFSLPKKSYIRTFYASKVSCRNNVIGFYIKAFTDNGVNSCWMNVNAFRDCLFTNNSVYGIVIGAMTNQMYNTIFEGCIIQHNGIDYDDEDYEAFGAGGIRLIHGSADFNNCYWEKNYARKIINGDEVLPNVISGNEGNVVINKGEYLNFHYCVNSQAQRLVCNNAFYVKIKIEGGYFGNPTAIGGSEITSDAIVDYLLASYPNELPVSNIGRISIICKNIKSANYTKYVYKILGQIGSSSNVKRKLIKEAYIDIDVSNASNFNFPIEYASCGNFREGVTFFVDSVNGNDKNTGTNPVCPLKTLEPLFSYNIDFPAVNLPKNINIVLLNNCHVANFSYIFGTNKGEHVYTFKAFDATNYPLQILVTSDALRLCTANYTTSQTVNVDEVILVSSNVLLKMIVSKPIEVISGKTLILPDVPLVEFVGDGKIKGHGTFRISENIFVAVNNDLSKVLLVNNILGTYATGQIKFNPTDVRMEMFNGTNWVNLDGSALS